MSFSTSSSSLGFSLVTYQIYFTIRYQLSVIRAITTYHVLTLSNPISHRIVYYRIVSHFISPGEREIKREKPREKKKITYTNHKQKKKGGEDTLYMCRTIQNTRWLCYGTRRCRPRDKRDPSVELRPLPFLESCDKRDPVTGVCHGDDDDDVVGGQQQHESEVVLSFNDGDEVAVVFDDDDDGDGGGGEGGDGVGGGDGVEEESESSVVWDDLLDDDDDSAVFYKTLECPKHHKQRLANLKEVWYVVFFLSFFSFLFALSFCFLHLSISPLPFPGFNVSHHLQIPGKMRKKEGNKAGEKQRRGEERRGEERSYS